MASRQVRGLFLVSTLAIFCLCVTGAVAAPQGGSGATHSSATVTVRLADAPGTVAIVNEYTADVMGFFAKNGIKIQYVHAPSGQSAIAALLAGGADVIYSDLITATFARAQGADIRFIAGNSRRFLGALQCRNGAGITGTYPSVMSKLVGRKVGVTSYGSATDNFLRYTLLSAGVDPSKVSIVNVGGLPNLIAAMASGNVDCVTSYEPMQQTLKGSVTTIVDWEKGEGPKAFAAPDYSFNAFATTADFANKNQQVVRAFASAIREAVNYASDPAHAAALAPKVAPFFPGVSISTLQDVLKNIAPTYSYKITRAAAGNEIKAYNAINPKNKILLPYRDYIATTMLDLTAPTVKFAATKKSGSRMTVRWSGVDKPGAKDITDIASGVKSYDIAVRRGSGGWRQHSAGSSIRTYSFTAGAAKTDVRVRGHDNAGNTGTWAQVTP